MDFKDIMCLLCQTAKISDFTGYPVHASLVFHYLRLQGFCFLPKFVVSNG